MAAKNAWLNREQAAPSNNIGWNKFERSHSRATVPLQQCSKKQIHRLLTKRNPFSLILQSFLNKNGLPSQMNWHGKNGLMGHLTPSRMDLLFRLQRNGLLLGTKRAAWGEPVQIYSLHCPCTLEFAKHLFWECHYANNIWSISCTLWRASSSDPISWTEVVKVFEAMLPTGLGRIKKCN